jgi:hypothetical protein
MSRQGPKQDGAVGRSSAVKGDLERPRYSPGLILQDSDLTAAVDYTRDLSRLLFRSLFGCGVVCGLTVSVESASELEVTVAPGLALDGCGDPIQLADTVTIGLGRRDGVLPEGGADRTGPAHKNLWVVLRGAELLCAPRELVCDADELDDLKQPTRIRASAEVSILFERPQCLCACQAPPANLSDQERTAYYKDLTKKQLSSDPKEAPDCHKSHAERIDCAPDGGCGAGCDCGCCVLLARLHWFDDEKAWAPIHAGERRFLRPSFGPDPVKNKPPASAAAARPGSAATR